MGCAGVGLLLLLGMGTACGRYGPPVRAQEYRDAERAAREAEQQRQRETTPESRNEPLPAAP
jgi:hypothetical protein